MVDLSHLTIHVTKPAGRPARLLAEMGLRVLPIEEHEENVDRYVVSERVAVERRTGSGFLRGIMDKTLFTSAIYLREHFAVPVLLVEGEVDYTHSRFDPQAVRGALSSMMLLYGVSVLASPTTEETVSLLTMMARQEQAGIPEISLIPKRKATDLPDLQRRLVEMLPGCGWVVARDLLQHFGSVQRVINAAPEDLLHVRGVGVRTAVQISRVVSAEYESVDTERDLETAIEAAPELLFPQPVTLLARQHGITTPEGRNVIDLVFLDPAARALILVEAKRGRLTQEHYRQLRRYLECAHQSRLLRRHLDRGVSLRGVLTTVEPGGFVPADPAVSVRVVARPDAIAVLKRRREERSVKGGPP
jgi:ERCC4-type nuclease